MLTTQPEVSVVVPCYNEEAIIEETASRLLHVLPACAADFELVFCNDGSLDGTWDVLRSLEARFAAVKAVGYQRNRGAGYAFREALRHTSGRYLIHMDADLAMGPHVVCESVKGAFENADVVVGSRYKGIAADYPWRRRIPSHLYSLLFRLLLDLPLRDAMSGFFGVRREVLTAIPELTMDGFEVYLELFWKAQARGFRIVEIPLKFSHQTASGEVSVLRQAPKQLFNTLRVWRRSRTQWKT